VTRLRLAPLVLLLPLVQLACASAPPKPAPPAGSVEVQYEANPAAPPATPPGGAATFWQGRKDLIQAPPPPKPAALALPRIDRFTLSNGLQVIVVPRKDLPVISFGLAVQAGGYDETRTTLGVSDFVAAMLRKGTKKRSADDISRAIDFVGGSLDAPRDSATPLAGPRFCAAHRSRQKFTPYTIATTSRATNGAPTKLCVMPR